MIYMVVLVMTQIFFAVPFLMEDAQAYAQSAFNIGRVFLYKWTVNWRFIEEDVFLSSRFAITLLVGHATVLILFGLFKWCELDGGVYRVLSRGILRPLHPPAALDKVDADCEQIYKRISDSELTGLYRCGNCIFHLQPNRNIIFSITSLSVLFLVCPTSSFSCLENSLSITRQVSFDVDSRF